MNNILFLPIIALILISCASKGNNSQQDLSEEELVKVELKRLNFSIKVPQRNKINEISSENFIDLTIIELNPERRYVKQISIGKLSSNIEETEGGFLKTYSFENGATLNYETSIEHGGSGGAEHTLTGILEFDGEHFLIGASDQEELGYADPTFCLKYLSTIERLDQLQQ